MRPACWPGCSEVGRTDEALAIRLNPMLTELSAPP